MSKGVPPKATHAVWQPMPTVREKLSQAEVTLQQIIEHHSFTLVLDNSQKSLPFLQ